MRSRHTAAPVSPPPPPGRSASVVLLGVAALLALPGSIGVSHADEPDKYGWWTEANPSSAVTTVLGAVGDPTGPQPDVPPGGFVVQGPGSRPVSVAAFVYQLAGEATAGQLALRLAAEPQAALPSNLLLCPLTSDFTHELGGAMSSAPTWDCTSSVPGQLDPDGKSYTFLPDRLVRGGRLAVALIADGAADRAVFERPGPRFLTVVASPASTPTPSTEVDEAPTPFDPTSSPPFGTASAPPSLPLLPPVVPAPPPVVAVPSEPPGQLPVVSSAGVSRLSATPQSPLGGAVIVLVSAIVIWIRSDRRFTRR